MVVRVGRRESYLLLHGEGAWLVEQNILDQFLSLEALDEPNVR